MLLAIDTGNTNTVFSVWDGEKFLFSLRTSTEYQRTADQYFVWWDTLTRHHAFPMPEITGDRLAKKLMTLRPDIPIIICTGYSERLDKADARQAGVRWCIDKPLKISETARIIRKVLDGNI